MLDVRDLTKRFGMGDSAVTALHEVNFSIAEGEFFTLLGPSGCGKTTLLRLIAGFEPPSGGAQPVHNFVHSGDNCTGFLQRTPLRSA